MASVINAVSGSGITQTADGSGVLKIQSNSVTTNALAWGSYLYVGSGSTPTLRSAYNISSITRNSAGNYTFAFTTAASDANYTVACSATNTSVSSSCIAYAYSKSTSSFIVTVGYVVNTGGGTAVFDYGLDFTVFGN